MEISIGGRPDFVLTRGKEILCYRFGFELYNGNVLIKRKTFVQKSLYMVAKDSQEYLFSVLPPSQWVGEIIMQDIRIESLGQTAIISLWRESAKDVSRAAGDGSGGMTSV